MHAADYAIVALYLAIVLMLGRRVRGGAATGDAFFLANRKLGRLRQFFFNFGHSTDANTAVSTVSFVYDEGASGAWLQLQLIFLNPYYWFMNSWFRRARLTTTADLFEDRLLSPGLARFYAVFQIGVAVIGIAFSNFVAYKVTYALSEGGIGIPQPVFYVFLVAVVGAYVVMGGLEATVMNQMFQGALVLVFSVILLPFGFHALGHIGLHARLAPEMFDVFAGRSGGQFTLPAVLAVLVVSVVQINGNIINMGISGSATDEFAARLGSVTGTYGKRVMIVLWVFVGLIAAALRQGPNRLADPDSAWGSLSRQLLGPGLLGVMLVGLLAANMASIATKTMAVSALAVRNLGGGRLKGGTEVRMARLASAAALAMSVIVALSMRGTFAVTKLILTINLPFGALVLMMFFWRRLTRHAAWWCIILTAVLITIEPIGARFTGDEFFGAGPWAVRSLGVLPQDCGRGWMLASQLLFDAAFPFLVLVVVSLLTRPPPPGVVEQFYGKMKTPVGETPVLEFAGMEATRLAPARFDHTKLFPGSSWEFTKWDRVDTVGFAACCAISASILASLGIALSTIG